MQTCDWNPKSVCIEIEVITPGFSAICIENRVLTHLALIALIQNIGAFFGFSEFTGASGKNPIAPNIP